VYALTNEPHNQAWQLVVSESTCASAAAEGYCEHCCDMWEWL
jgi:hypothetical protein